MTDVVVAFEGWNAANIGWGEQSWGVSVLDTGVQAIGFVGQADVAENAEVLATGLQGTMALGLVAAAANADVLATGVQAQGQIGNVMVWSIVDDSQTPNWQNILT